MGNAPAWECQRSVEADVSVSFAWQYMTNVSNWSDPPAEFELDGPFAAGSRGTTRMPGQPPNTWMIRDVDSGRAYTLEGGSFLDGAVLLCHWRFDPVSNSRTRLTQRLELWGENAATYIDGIRSGFEPNLEPGMKNIAEAMARRQVLVARERTSTTLSK
jgi:hypothetical protein